MAVKYQNLTCEFITRYRLGKKCKINECILQLTCDTRQTFTVFYINKTRIKQEKNLLVRLKTFFMLN